MIHHADLVVVVVLTLINVETDKWSSNYMMVNLHQHFSLFILVLFRESRMDKEISRIMYWRKENHESCYIIAAISQTISLRIIWNNRMSVWLFRRILYSWLFLMIFLAGSIHDVLYELPPSLHICICFLTSCWANNWHWKGERA